MTVDDAGHRVQPKLVVLRNALSLPQLCFLDTFEPLRSACRCFVTVACEVHTSRVLQDTDLRVSTSSPV